MVGHGLGLECSSLYELHLAIRSGCDPQGILCIGPGKSQALIQRCIQQGIGAIYCESIDELELIQSACNAYDRSIQVVLRVHIEKPHRMTTVTMAGKHNPFGIDETGIEWINEHHTRWDRCQLIGFHHYQGSGQDNIDAIRSHIERAHTQLIRWRESWHRPLHILGIGLGLNQSDDRAMNANITECLRCIDGCQINIELGRSLVRNAGQMLCQVQYTKTIRGEDWAILDTGYHHLMDLCFQTTFLRRYPSIQPLIKKDGPTRSYRLAGPLCTPSDRLHHAFQSSPLHRGDFLLIQNVGAYTWNHSPTFFLGHAPADQIFLTPDELHRSDPYSDFINYHKDAHEGNTK